MLNIIGVCFFIVSNIMKHVRLSYLSVDLSIKSLNLLFWRYWLCDVILLIQNYLLLIQMLVFVLLLLTGATSSAFLVSSA